MNKRLASRFPALGSRRWSVLESLCWAVSAASVIWLICLVYRHAVPIPMHDDWEMAPLVVKSKIGGLTFRDFFDQQQESRTLIPKLIFVLLAAGRHWDVRAEMALSIAICLATVAGIYALLVRGRFSSRQIAVALLLIVPLVFSPVQHELWLLASGFPSFLPMLCIVGGLLIALSKMTTPRKLIFSAFLCLISSFSLANGLLAWGLTFPVWLIVAREGRWKPWLGLLLSF